MEMNLLYVHTSHMGYGRMGVNLAEQLTKQHVTVYDHLPGTENLTRTDGNSKEFLKGAIPGRSNVVCWAAAPSHAAGWWKGQMPCLLTMFETMRIPEGFRAALPNFEVVMVPSRQNQELFSEYHDNVQYVPLGVDPETWQFRTRPPVDRYFRFLIGGRGARKGTDVAVKAFTILHDDWAQKKSGPEPRLLMKNPVAEDYWRGDGAIEMISGRISQEEEVALYASAHCYLGPSRGEGFGLQPLQAIAQGCPTILTNAHGHESFAHLGWPIGWKPQKAGYFIYGDSGDWWDPSLDDLVDNMRWIHNNYDTAQSYAVWGSGKALAEFTWENTTNLFLDAIGRENLTPYKGPNEWVEREELRYKLVTTKDWPCDIGGSSYFFKKGEEYWQLADVKRVLFEAGLLDPVCLLEDDPDRSGLAVQQLAVAGKYRAEHAHCPTCLQPLNQ